MKKITFIRHAKSDWNLPELMDFDRPLNERGRNNAPNMGARMAKYEECPQLILLSAAVRTKETMKLFSEKAGWQDCKKIEKDWLYLASPQEYIKTVEKLANDLHYICFCGHNPTITAIINYYSGENLVNVPTCGLGMIEFDVDDWSSISRDSGRLMHYDYPKNPS